MAIDKSHVLGCFSFLHAGLSSFFPPSAYCFCTECTFLIENLADHSSKHREIVGSVSRNKPPLFLTTSKTLDMCPL